MLPNHPGSSRKELGSGEGIMSVISNHGLAACLAGLVVWLPDQKKEPTLLPHLRATCLVIIMPLAYMANRLDSEPSHEREWTKRRLILAF